MDFTGFGLSGKDELKMQGSPDGRKKLAPIGLTSLTGAPQLPGIASPHVSAAREMFPSSAPPLGQHAASIPRQEQALSSDLLRQTAVPFAQPWDIPNDLFQRQIQSQTMREPVIAYDNINEDARLKETNGILKRNKTRPQRRNDSSVILHQERKGKQNDNFQMRNVSFAEETDQYYDKYVSFKVPATQISADFKISDSKNKKIDKPRLRQDEQNNGHSKTSDVRKKDILSRTGDVLNQFGKKYSKDKTIKSDNEIPKEIEINDKNFQEALDEMSYSSNETNSARSIQSSQSSEIEFGGSRFLKKQTVDRTIEMDATKVISKEVESKLKNEDVLKSAKEDNQHVNNARLDVGQSNDVNLYRNDSENDFLIVRMNSNKDFIVNHHTDLEKDVGNYDELNLNELKTQNDELKERLEEVMDENMTLQIKLQEECMTRELNERIIVDLRDIKAKLEDEINSLAEELNATKNDANNVSKELKNISTQSYSKELLDEVITSLESKIEQEKNNAQLIAEQSASKIKIMSIDIADLKQQAVEANESFRKAKEQVNLLNDELKHKDNEDQALEIVKLREQLIEFDIIKLGQIATQKKNDELMKNSEEDMDEIRELKHRLKSAMGDLAHEKMLSSMLEDQLKDSADAIKEVEDEKMELESKLAEVNDQLVELKNNFELTTCKLEGYAQVLNKRIRVNLKGSRSLPEINAQENYQSSDFVSNEKLIDFQASLEGAMQDIEMLQEKLKEAYIEKTKIEEQLDQAKNSIDILKVNLEDEIAKNCLLQRKLEFKNEDPSSLSANKEGGEEENEKDNVLEFQTIIEERNELIKIVDFMENELIQFKNEVGILKKENVQLKEKLGEYGQAEMKNGHYKAEIDCLKDQIKQGREEICQLENKKEQQNDKILSLENDVKLSRNKMNRMVDIASEQANYKTPENLDEVEVLQNLMQEKNKEMTKLRKEIQSLHDKLNIVNRKLSDSHFNERKGEEQIVNLREEINSKTEKIDQLLNSLQLRECEIRKLEESVPKENKDCIESYKDDHCCKSTGEKEVRRLTEAITQKKDLIESIQTKYCRAEEEIDGLRNEVKEQNDKIHILVKEINKKNSDLEGYQEVNGDHCNEIQSLERDVKQRNTDIEILKKCLEDKNEQIQLLVKELNDLHDDLKITNNDKKRVDDREDDNKQEKEEMDLLRKEIYSKNEKIYELLHDIDCKEDEIRTLEDEVEKLNNERYSPKNLFCQSEEDNMFSQNKNKESIGEIERLNRDLSEHIQEINGLRNQIDFNREKVASLHNEIKLKEEKIQSLLKEMDHKDDEIFDMKIKNKDFCSHIRNLEDEVKAMGKSIDSLQQRLEDYKSKFDGFNESKQNKRCIGIQSELDLENVLADEKYDEKLKTFVMTETPSCGLKDLQLLIQRSINLLKPSELTARTPFSDKLINEMQKLQLEILELDYDREKIHQYMTVMLQNIISMGESRVEELELAQVNRRHMETALKLKVEEGLTLINDLKWRCNHFEGSSKQSNILIRKLYSSVTGEFVESVTDVMINKLVEMISFEKRNYEETKRNNAVLQKQLHDLYGQQLKLEQENKELKCIITEYQPEKASSSLQTEDLSEQSSIEPERESDVLLLEKSKANKIIDRQRRKLFMLNKKLEEEQSIRTSLSDELDILKYGMESNLSDTEVKEIGCENPKTQRNKQHYPSEESLLFFAKFKDLEEGLRAMGTALHSLETANEITSKELTKTLCDLFMHFKGEYENLLKMRFRQNFDLGPRQTGNNFDDQKEVFEMSKNEKNIDEVIALKEKINELERERDSLLEDVMNFKMKLGVVDRELQTKSVEHGSLEKECQRHMKQELYLQNTLEKERSLRQTDFVKLTSKLEERDNEIELLENKLRCADRQIQDLKDEMKLTEVDLKDQIRKVKQYNRIESRIGSNSLITDLKREVKEIKKRYKCLEDGKNYEIETLNGELTQAKCRIREMKSVADSDILECRQKALTMERNLSMLQMSTRDDGCDASDVAQELTNVLQRFKRLERSLNRSNCQIYSSRWAI